MKHGWSFQVSMEVMSGHGARVNEIWYAFIEDQADALQAVKDLVQRTPDVQVTVGGQLPENALLGVGMKPSQVGRWL
jgi:hypothetical protein